MERPVQFWSEVPKKKTYMTKEELENKILMLQLRIDKITDMLLAPNRHECTKEEAVKECLALLLPEDGKDLFCPTCCYSFNGVLDSECGLVTCERFNLLAKRNKEEDDTRIRK